MFTIARELAVSYPDAKLPCPVCANTLAARNLSSHLTKVHADAGVTGPWRGRRFVIFPASLVHDDGAIALRTLLGRRTVKLPCSIELGTRFGSHTAAGMSSYADDHDVPHHDVRIGWYLTLGGSITIGCNTAANAKSHWTGWQQGPRRRMVDIVVSRRVLVDVEYVLAATGAWSPVS
jgi:hypothetical protein